MEILNTLYKIKNMHCASCAQLIRIELDEHGYKSVLIDSKNNTLSIPPNHSNDLLEIKKVIEKAGDYTIEQL